MQAYWNNPENKHLMMVLMIEDHEGFPPVLTPDAPEGSGALDYEERLGIPVPIALVGEWVWLGAPKAYADTWPARFFDTIQPNQNLSAVVWKVVEMVMLVMRDHGRNWPVLGEHLLAVLASAPLSTPDA
jgi:hypothetical protein